MTDNVISIRSVDAKEAEPSSATFAELLPAFAELFDPDPSRIIALAGRMKRLIALGAARQLGRGKTVHFGCAEVRRLFVAMELCHLGFSPEKAITLLNENESEFFGALEPVTIKITGRRSGVTIDVPHLRDVVGKHNPQLLTGRREHVSLRPLAIDLNVSRRVARAVALSGARYADEVATYTAADFLRLPNFGRKALRELESALAEFQLSLRVARYDEPWTHPFWSTAAKGIR